MNTKLIMLMESLRSFIKREDGASAIEYALIAGLIAVAIITAVTLVGTDITAVFNNIAAELKKVGGSTGGG
ncbi:Flp family type IVb pilin [Halopseudomonas sp. SMJS2]|uniref:Flp family type IVb pilin n=1 Tax=Halopseudomonas sp. SMJS2 TaxID=3041098 RepID=UPI002452B58B|nr:Flp family type IVb pilin [Halopseudomonas sp. SMJS2]WGK61775.1 Flp family type IVb pilin [Halopseudomonas sp. SMJS2]